MTEKTTEKQLAQIHGLTHDGRGVATVNGKTLFVEGGLPSESVVFENQKKHRRYTLARAIEILNPSPTRTKPHCTHFELCGGCSLQHMTNDAQVEMKQNLLLTQLQHFGGVVPQSVLPPLRGSAFYYRRKARIGVRYVIKKEKLLVGFREKNSNKIADLSCCEVLDPRVGKLMPMFPQLIQGLVAFDSIPQIEVAVGDTQVALIFRHLKPLNDGDQGRLTDFAKAHNLQLYLQPDGPNSIHLLWAPEPFEPLSYRLPEYNIHIQFKPTDFTQVNADINQKMIQLALQLLEPKPTDVILDLFCGLGNFTLPLALMAKKVIGVEGSASLVERAFENAQLNHVDNVDFQLANLEDSQLNQNWLNQEYDKILLDPPRTGAFEILKYMPGFKAKTIVYVSCNPATLARDVGELVSKYGYQLKAAGVMDMFPQTAHVESIALLQKV
jgi:23S rRNA (uracil1939-C5)-methyltransferase